MKMAVKKIERAVAAKVDAQAMLPDAYQAIDKALKRGVLKANTAARVKSRLARLVRVSA
ncbi:MAG: Ribosomal protein [Candidatus Parcubacteria bacterium]